VLLTNHAEARQLVARGDRVAQLLVLPVARPMLDVVPELSVTARGEGGFGSTDDAEGAAP
jgi:dUTP pyrophosphatase